MTLHRTRSITHPVVPRGWLLERRITRYECCYFFACAYNTLTVCYYDDDYGGQNIDVYLHFAPSVPVTSRAKHVRPSTAALFERTRPLSTVTTRCTLHTIQKHERRDNTVAIVVPPTPLTPAIFVCMYTHLRRYSRPVRIIHVRVAFDEKRYPAAIPPYRTIDKFGRPRRRRDTIIRARRCYVYNHRANPPFVVRDQFRRRWWLGREKTVLFCIYKSVRRDNPKPVARPYATRGGEGQRHQTKKIRHANRGRRRVLLRAPEKNSFLFSFTRQHFIIGESMSKKSISTYIVIQKVFAVRGLLV